MTDDGWIFTDKKLTAQEAERFVAGPDLAFYNRALAINAEGNNRGRASAGIHARGAIINARTSTRHPFNENDARAKKTPPRDTSKCSIENGEHWGEVGNSFYRDRQGKPHFQILCALCRGNHWQLVRDVPVNELGEYRRTKKKKRRQDA